jgi:two-component system OmpR family response regulator
MANAAPLIFVAEDDDAVLELVRLRLDLAGYRVAYARDGLEAFNAIRRLQPAAVVLDLNLPRLDGFGVLESMWAMKIRIPVLVLTARNAGDDVRRCIALGARDFLTKPFDDQRLLQRVARLVRPSKDPADAPLRIQLI